MTGQFDPPSKPRTHSALGCVWVAGCWGEKCQTHWKTKVWGLGALSKLAWRAKLLRNMLSPTLPAHRKGVKGQTLAAQGRQGRTDTLWTRVGFCVTVGHKLRNVPRGILFQGIDEA